MWHIHVIIVIFSFGFISIPLSFNVGVTWKIIYLIVSGENKIFNKCVTKKENPIYLSDYLDN